MGNAPSTWTTELLVDKLIGTPYEFVKFVANNISLVQIVGKALSSTDITEPMVTMRSVIFTGSMGILGQTIQFALPEGIDATKIVGISVSLAASNGTRYFNDGERYFYLAVTPTDLIVELRADAPAPLANSVMTCFLTLTR